MKYFFNASLSWAWDSWQILIECVWQVEDSEDGVKLHRIERTAGIMKRSVRLPDTADMSKITARYQDGVLNFSVPKHEAGEEQSRVITIE